MIGPARLLLLFFFLLQETSFLPGRDWGPLEGARRVADRVVGLGTGKVGFRLVPAGPSRPVRDLSSGRVAFSLATVVLPGATKGGRVELKTRLVVSRAARVRFQGLPGNPPVRLCLDGREILRPERAVSPPLSLEKGAHSLRLEILLPPKRPLPVRFRVLEGERPFWECRLAFPGKGKGGGGAVWLFRRPPSPGEEGSSGKDGDTPWRVLPGIRVPEISSPFPGWIYPQGVLLYALARLARETGEKRYKDFLAAWWGTARRLHEDSLLLARRAPWIRGPYWIRFRRRALDDTGAMGVAAAEAFFLLKDPFCRETALDMAEYAHKEQTRLPGGTFDRVDGSGRITLWVDDLFMGCPVMVRRFQITGEEEYLEDAARQILGMAGRLQRPDGLFMHGMRVTGKRPVSWAWGRGNGWAMVAETEVLAALPVDHPLRARVLEVFRRHVKGILPLQSEGGMWRQVLDLPQSWEETSCSAMFVLSLARGVRRGWLDGRAARAVEAGWKGLAARISRKGSVRGICVGTNLGRSLEDYLERPERTDDLHGLGPVILAGLETARMLALPGEERR